MVSSEFCHYSKKMSSKKQIFQLLVDCSIPTNNHGCAQGGVICNLLLHAVLKNSTKRSRLKQKGTVMTQITLRGSSFCVKVDHLKVPSHQIRSA